MGKLRFSSLSPPSRPAIKLPKLTRAHLDVLDYMQDFDAVPSMYVKCGLHSFHYARQKLNELAQAGFIGIPGGYNHMNARKRVRPLEVRPLGYQALKESGLYRPRAPMNDHFNHRYSRSVVDHSFRRGPKEISGLTYITEKELLDHPSVPASTKADPNPSWFVSGKHTVRPDAPLFGLRYRGAMMAFLGYELDRGTERQTAKPNYARKTTESMFLRYADYLGRGEWKHRWGLSQITIPVIAIGQQRMENMLTVLQATVSDVNIQKRFAFKALPDFIGDGPLPPPTAHMVTEDWLRVDGPFNILTTLKQTAERKALSD